MVLMRWACVGYRVCYLPYWCDVTNIAHKMFSEMSHFAEGSTVICKTVDDWLYVCWRHLI